MTDISKCDGKDCDQRETCLRFLAPCDPYRQSFFAPPVRGKDCEYYWPVSPAKDEAK